MAQKVKDLVLSLLWLELQLWCGFSPWPWNFHMLGVKQKKKKKKILHFSPYASKCLKRQASLFLERTWWKEGRAYGESLSGPPRI